MVDEVYDYILHTFYIIIIIPIVFGNVLILISIRKFKKLRTSMHILIGNLAVADLLVGLVLIPYDLVATFGKLYSHKYVCLGRLTLFVTCLGCSCYSLLLISIERFAAIMFPLHARAHFTKYRLILMIGFGWMFIAVTGMIPIYGWNEYDANNSECVSDTLLKPEYKNLCNWQLIFGLAANFVLYAVVMRKALRQAKTTRLGGDLTIHTKAKTDLHQLTTMVIVLGMFVLCWLPYICVGVVITFHETSYTQYIRRYALIPGLFNSAINWMIYGYRNKGFQTAFKIILRFKGYSGRTTGDRREDSRPNTSVSVITSETRH